MLNVRECITPIMLLQAYYDATNVTYCDISTYGNIYAHLCKVAKELGWVLHFDSSTMEWLLRHYYKLIDVYNNGVEVGGLLMKQPLTRQDVQMSDEVHDKLIEIIKNSLSK